MQTTTERPAPRIGEAAMFWHAGVRMQGTIMDIRHQPDGARLACIAVLGWPEMSYVDVAGYYEQRDGVWRACEHRRGFNAAGLCFDCLNPAPTQ